MNIVGLVGFVGLVVPHIARIVYRKRSSAVAAGLCYRCAALVTFADTAARSWFDPIEFPVGILLALSGAPFFLYLLRKGVRT